MSERGELARQCVILLFGEGELEIPHNLDVRLMGRLNSAEKLAQVYASSDVFVSPSMMETFGMALAEAQACGTPVVAFDVGGISEQISPSNGLLIKMRDTSSLAEGLSQFFDQQSAYEPQLIAQAAANEYAVDRVISQHTALYSSLVG